MSERIDGDYWAFFGEKGRRLGEEEDSRIMVSFLGS